MNYDEMPAGREMDALIAEKVMGWTTYEEYVHGPLMHGGGMMTLYRGDGAQFKKDNTTHTWSVDCFCPSTDIAAAWEVVEKLADEVYVEYGHRPSIQSHGNVGWLVRFRFHRGTWADTVPLAICRAALKVVGE